MSYELLSKVYDALTQPDMCPSENDPGQDLWQGTEAASGAVTALYDAIFGDRSEPIMNMDDLVFDAIYETERCGFINGFRLGMQLARELGEGDGQNEEHAGI